MLDSQQKSNAQQIRLALEEVGLKNKFVQDAVVVVAWKESGLFPLRESCYNKTPNADIRRIFGSMVSSLSEDELSALKQDCVKFFNKVYGGRLGNSATEGYKYRGRGYVQITGKSNYTTLGKKIGVDLASNPDLLLDRKIGAKALAQYYKDAENNPIIKNYGATSLNELKDLDSALKAIFHITAGVGKSSNSLFVTDSTGGWKKIQQNKNTIVAETTTSSANYLNYILLLGLGIGVILFSNKKLRNQLSFFK